MSTEQKRGRRPLNDYLLIKPLPPEKKKGSIIIPLNHDLPYKAGIVFLPSAFATQTFAGEKVLYYKRGIVQADVEVDGQLYDLVKEGSLMIVDE